MEDDPNKVTVEAEKPKTEDPIRGIKKANKTLQTERDALREQLATLQKSIDDSKLSDSEKTAASLKELNDKLAAAQAEAAQAKAEADRERKVGKLVAKHKLLDPEYGELVLKKYNPAEHEDFDAFVDDLRKQPSYSRLFEPTASDRVVDEDGSDIVPRVAGSSNKKAGNSWEVKEREFAKSMFPGDKAAQEAFIATQRELRGK